VSEATRSSLQISVTDRIPVEWPVLLADSDSADFFHTGLWSRAVAGNLPAWRSVWLLAHQGGQLVGGLSAVSRRRALVVQVESHFEGTTGGPLVRRGLDGANQERIGAALLAALARLGHPWPTLAGCTLPAGLAGRFGDWARAAGWSVSPVEAALLPLAGGIEHVEMHVFKKNRRNERNRSLKHGCLADVTTDMDVLSEYYPVYYDLARHWSVTPTPLGLLRDLLCEGQGSVFLSVVRYAGEVIGGHLCVQHRDRVTAWNGATRPQHNDKFPATLLIWTDLQEACRRGATWLDLGGSGGIATLANFKKLLGAQTETRLRLTRAPRLLTWLAGWRARRHRRRGRP
jgi:hypothetical protein